MARSTAHGAPTRRITVVDRAVALLVSLRPDDIASLPPAERRRVADECRRVASMAEPRNGATPKAGVLADKLMEQARAKHDTLVQV